MNKSIKTRQMSFSLSAEKPIAGKRPMTSVGMIALTALLVSQSSLGFGAPQQKGKPKAVASPKQAVPPVSEQDRIVHVLNRLGFGARPDDIEMVRKVGLKTYIEKQLYPDKIDDSAVETKLQTYEELNLPNSDIETRYNAFIDADQTINRLRRQARLAATASQAATPAAMTEGATTPPPKPSLKELAAGDPDLEKQMTEAREQLVKVAEPVGLLHQEFNAAKLIRAVESQRQLQEVLVDFWGNHFNIDVRKAPCGVLKVIDDRDVIRPHIWGKFRDLLGASAKSPAMLVYLDNFQSVSDQVPPPPARRRAAAAQANGAVIPPPRKKAGLNENYAREIMELHTLGVDGGYTQQDVREVARCFTGWSTGSTDGERQRINRYGQVGEFVFYPRVHDDGEKVVLGHTIPAGGGIQDGETVLDILASNPATWRHISYQLCQRLVSDEPPASLVDKCVKTWKQTDGDLRQVVRTIVTSPEFFSPTTVRTKIKSPFEYAVSCVRALNGTLDANALVSRRQLAREANGLVRPPQGGGYLNLNTTTLLGQIGTMGQPLFQYQAPTGFPEDSRKWVSSGALISRLNFSLALTQGRVSDVVLEDPSEDAGATMDANVMIDRASGRILHGQISPSTRATLLREAKSDSASPATPATIAALLLGSPEFQRR